MTTIKDLLFNRGSMPKVREVKLGELTAYVRKMTAGERRAYRQDIVSTEGQPAKQVEVIPRALLVRTICDMQGNREFQDSEVESLDYFDTDDFDKLYFASLELNERQETAVEDELKNSQQTEG